MTVQLAEKSILCPSHTEGICWQALLLRHCLPFCHLSEVDRAKHAICMVFFICVRVQMWIKFFQPHLLNLCILIRMAHCCKQTVISYHICLRIWHDCNVFHVLNLVMVHPSCRTSVVIHSAATVKTTRLRSNKNISAKSVLTILYWRRFFSVVWRRLHWKFGSVVAAIHCAVSCTSVSCSHMWKQTTV